MMAAAVTAVAFGSGGGGDAHWGPYRVPLSHAIRAPIRLAYVPFAPQVRTAPLKLCYHSLFLQPARKAIQDLALHRLVAQ